MKKSKKESPESAETPKAAEAPKKAKKAAGAAPAAVVKAKTPEEIVSEVITAGGSKPRKDGEKDSKFFGRIAKACADLPDDKWGSLSSDAQTWLNSALSAINDGRPVTGPGAQSEATATDAGEKKSKKAKKDEGPRVARDAAPRLDSAVTKLRILAIQNPTMTAEQLFQKHGTEIGLKPATVQTIYQHVRATMAVARHLGLVK